MITENSIKHLKMTCKFNWCSISWSNVGITRSISWLNMNEWKLLGVCLCRGGGGIWVWGLDLFIWFPAESLCCLTGTCTNSLNHGRIIDRVADFPLAPLQSASQTPLMNANWVVFFPLLHECLSHPPRFLCAPLKLTPFVTCERLHVSSGQWVSKVNSSERCFCTEQNWTLNSPVCKWPYV